MIVCGNCRREMVCSSTGVVVLWGSSHGRAGDEYTCGACNNVTIHTTEGSMAVTALVAAALKSRGKLREVS